MEEIFTDKAQYGHRLKDFTFRGMPTWVREMYRITERNATRRNIPFNLTRQEFREIVERSEGRCMMTGIKFEFEPYEGSCRRPFAPSLDRIDSSKGYSVDNCRLICVLVNLAMNQWGFWPLFRAARHLVQRQEELRQKETEGLTAYRPAGFLSVSEYSRQNQIELRKPHFTLIGSAASRACRKAGINRTTVWNKRQDGSDGFIPSHVYPEPILAKAFEEVLSR